ncbi:unnamed protein product [Cylindrotheca closterium]|uniref:Uncharacterized protein n=1 Tax=Cylindrotheca closterium TaxID=2856 RepID=A0AAD2FCH6_9STRA|nr:unnamed protein product [Cylindrotheca closterium]
MQPEFQGSGRSPEEDTRESFPKNADLVDDISNSALLLALLPALDDFNCLDAPVYKGRRSPWVRAFCQLYHPSGPWGENTFKNVPNQTSNSRHSFKSYKIPRIFALLENCSHLESSEPHKRVYKRLKDFKEKESYYKEFMEACKTLAVEEASKEASERAPIPKNVSELPRSAPVAGNSQNVIIVDDATPYEGKRIFLRNGVYVTQSSSSQANGAVPNQDTAFANTHNAEKNNTSSETTQAQNTAANRDGDRNVDRTAGTVDFDRDAQGHDNAKDNATNRNRERNVDLVVDTVNNKASTHNAEVGASSETIQLQNAAVNRDGDRNVDPTADAVGDEASTRNAETCPTSEAMQVQNTAVDRHEDKNANPTADAINDDTVEFESSFDNDPDEQENDWSSQETDEVEAVQVPLTQDAVDSAGNNDKMALDKKSSGKDAHANNDTEPSGKKRGSSSSESLSPKRRRFEMSTPTGNEPHEPSSPGTKGTMASLVKPVSPDTRPTTPIDREQILNRKRDKLSNMLQQRESRYGQEDTIIKKLHGQIMIIDEELLEMILAE